MARNIVPACDTLFGLALQDCRAGCRHIECRDWRSRGQLRELALDEAGIDIAARHLRVPNQPPEKREIICDANNFELTERMLHAEKRRRTILAPDNKLGEQRVVVRCHRIAGAKAAIDADALSHRLAPGPDYAGRRQKALRAIFGINARLDGVTICA